MVDLSVFVIRKVQTGFKFDLKAPNGETVLTSEVYTTEAACRKGIESVRKNATAAKLEDQTEPEYYQNSSYRMSGSEVDLPPENVKIFYNPETGTTYVYAANNIEEYFAEGVQTWFNVNTEVNAEHGNGVHNMVNTREELKRYDPRLHAILSRYFPDTDEHVSRHKKVNRFNWTGE